jgi:hypothetical protein
MTQEEKVYLDEDGILVTSSRFVVPGETYAMSGITSVKGASKSTVVASLLIGLFGLYMGTVHIIYGALFIGAAALWYFQSKHMVVLTTASGASEALSSRDKDKIFRIIDALNDSIIGRG